FCFVKFKEVKEVEQLSIKLEEVWLGSYKLRVNLSRYGRNGSKKPGGQRKRVGVRGDGETPVHGVGRDGETPTHAD
ncbi:hypothetical protein A2U01_0090711, partial [Trifolium medium]|nr:hypothetical protein [Trifolium medium]